MYLVRTVTDRGRSLTLAQSVVSAPDAQAGREVDRAIAVARRWRPGFAGGGRGHSRPHRGAAQRAGATLSALGRPARRRGDIPARGRLATFPVVLPFMLMEDVGSGEERIARHRAGDAVLRRSRPWALCRLRQLEDGVDDGRGGRPRSWAPSTRSADESRAVGLGCARGLDGHEPHSPMTSESSGRRASPATNPTWEFAATAVSHVGSATATDYTSAIGVGRSRPAAPRGQGQLRVGRCAFGLRRLDLFRGRRVHLGADAPDRRRSGARRRPSCRPGGEPWHGGGSTSTSRLNTCAKAASATAAISTPGANSAFDPSSGCASALPPSAPGCMAASVTSSAGRSCKRPGAAHDRRLLVQPGIEQSGVHRVDRRSGWPASRHSH